MTEPRQLRDRIAQVDGGELTDLPRGYAYSVVFPAKQSRTFIYATKSRAASELLAAADGDVPVGMICRGGLPQVEDLPGITRVVGDSAAYFLGDCDPFDLLVFAWLRQHLPIQFLGVSDRVLSALGVALCEQITIEMPDGERQAFSLLREVWPDFAESVGPICASMLSDHRKLELEALVSFLVRPLGLWDLLQ